MSPQSSSKVFYADVIIPTALPTIFTWVVPPTLLDEVKVGCRVEVNLGKKKTYAGLVKRVYQSQVLSAPVKPILQVLDKAPIVSLLQLQFWEWMASYYQCTEGEVMAAALPANFRLSSDIELCWNEGASDDFSHFTADEYMVAEALLVKKKLQLSEVQAMLNRQSIFPLLDQLLKHNVAIVRESLLERYRPKKLNYLSWAPMYKNPKKLESLLNNWEGSERQLNLLLRFIDLSANGSFFTAQQLSTSTGESTAVIKALVEKGILVIQAQEVSRITQQVPINQVDFKLSSSQSNAFQKIEKSFLEKDICLLHGVTSSGKTNIYIQLISQLLLQKKQILYLVPEIALTTQAIQRLEHHFGGNVGVYHSKFSANERVEIWNRVRSGQLKVILGARSAVFLPFESLGLVICDEEHESSFKQQDPAPRYNGRDAAIYLAALYKAKVLLGSATPSLESYYHANSGKYALVELKERFGSVAIPSVELIDRKLTPQIKKTATIITSPLKQAIQNALEQNRQVILFQNRRGYVPYQICASCGWVPRCLQCDVSLTHHKKEQHLQCHYCGNKYALVERCGSCGKNKFIQKNFGTELVEEDLKDLFPTARIERMDIDTVKGKYAHERLIHSFEKGDIDILVGTQMVVKGLDVAKVDVVGVLDADGLMQFADFRVHERAFQLMEQVSGRAGRRQTKGRVLIQTYNPTQHLFEYVKQHDYKAFFKEELGQRELFFYPPYSKLIVLSVRHMQESIAKSAAAYLANLLGSTYRQYLRGPAPAIIYRVRNQYRMELLLKLPRKAGLISQCKLDIKSAVAIVRQKKQFSKVSFVIDVDPT